MRLWAVCGAIALCLENTTFLEGLTTLISPPNEFYDRRSLTIWIYLPLPVVTDAMTELKNRGVCKYSPTSLIAEVDSEAKHTTTKGKHIMAITVPNDFKVYTEWVQSGYLEKLAQNVAWL